MFPSVMQRSSAWVAPWCGNLEMACHRAQRHSATKGEDSIELIWPQDVQVNEKPTHSQPVSAGWKRLPVEAPLITSTGIITQEYSRVNTEYDLID